MKLVRHPYVVRLHEACDIFFLLSYSVYGITCFWADKLLIKDLLKEILHEKQFLFFK